MSSPSKSKAKTDVDITSLKSVCCYYDESDPASVVCSICYDGEVYNQNEIVFCDTCDVAVHLQCYGIKKLPSGNWYCCSCAQGLDSVNLQCGICFQNGGALKATEAGTWVHISCYDAIPEIENDASFGLFLDLSDLDKKRFNLKCRLCTNKGACVQCQFKRCSVAIHPWCFMNRESNFVRKKLLARKKDGTFREEWVYLCPTHRDNLISDDEECNAETKTDIKQKKKETNKNTSKRDVISSTPTPTPKLSDSSKHAKRSINDTEIIEDSTTLFKKSKKVLSHEDFQKLGNLISKYNQIDSPDDELLSYLIQFMEEYLPPNENNDNLLHWCTRNQRVDLINALCRLCNINETNNDNETAVYIAASLGYNEILRLLLSHNANCNKGKVNSVYHYEESPLLVACRGGYIDCVETLLEYQCHIVASFDEIESPQLVASKLGFHQILQLLTLKGANVEDPNIDGDTCLIAAAKGNHRECIEVLLRRLSGTS